MTPHWKFEQLDPESKETALSEVQGIYAIDEVDKKLKELCFDEEGFIINVYYEWEELTKEEQQQILAEQKERDEYYNGQMWQPSHRF
jgi:hypothetical protein